MLSVRFCSVTVGTPISVSPEAVFSGFLHKIHSHLTLFQAEAASVPLKTLQICP